MKAKTSQSFAAYFVIMALVAIAVMGVVSLLGQDIRELFVTGTMLPSESSEHEPSDLESIGGVDRRQDSQDQ